MTTYTNTRRPKRLREGDKVVFNLREDSYRYEVLPRYLHSPFEANDTIFKRLKLDKHAFAGEAYGYEPEGLFADWPEAKGRGFAALCRLVNALYDEIDRREKKEKKEEEKPSPGKPTKDTTLETVFKVGDYLEGYDSDGNLCRGLCTRVTSTPDPLQTYELGFGRWISGASAKLIKPSEPPLTSLGWAWGTKPPSEDTLLDDIGLCNDQTTAKEEAKESELSPVYVFELFAGPVKKYTNQLVEETF